MPGGECVQDKDCTLHNDCCDCFGGPGARRARPICKKGCDQKQCELLGISQADLPLRRLRDREGQLRPA
jgi:hypothetical protein